MAALALIMAAAWTAVATALPTVGSRFSSKCEPSHTLADDPIVYPGKPGWSHEHQFFGARLTDAFSKPRVLRGGQTTCNRDADTAAYWIPTLEIGDSVVEPQFAQAYYDDGSKRRDTIKPFPPGLRMIAGRAGADRPQRADRVSWYCLAPVSGFGRNGNLLEKAIFQAGHQSIPTADPYCKNEGETLSALIYFPDCWNGRSVDSRNHRRHVTYSKRPEGGWYNRCPRSHPVPMPQILFAIHYPTPGSANPSQIAFSSGGRHSLHADFMNAWRQRELARLVRSCLNLSLC